MQNPVKKWWNQADLQRTGNTALRTVAPAGIAYTANQIGGASNDEANSAAMTALGTQGALNLGSAAKRWHANRQVTKPPVSPPAKETTATKNALIGTAAGVAATPALKATQATADALSGDPKDPDAKSWAGAPYRGVRDLALSGASGVLGKPKPDQGLPWDKIALGGGAAALLAALLYKTMGSDKSEEDDSEEG
jgi:hypothetical protein